MIHIQHIAKHRIKHGIQLRDCRRTGRSPHRTAVTDRYVQLAVAVLPNKEKFDVWVAGGWTSTDLAPTTHGLLRHVALRGGSLALGATMSPFPLCPAHEPACTSTLSRHRRDT